MPKFLQDTPNIRLTNADETFEANKNILEEIVSDNNSPRKLIALSGKWGSGKSTVLNQLDKEKNHTITFDVWGIIEDQQFKRSFLTFLYRKLLKTKKKVCLSLPKTSISLLLNAIKGSTIQTTTENTPIWKSAAKLLGIFTALSLLWAACSSIVATIAKLELWYSPPAGRVNFLITILLVDSFIKFFLLLVNKQNIRRTVLFSLIMIVIAGLAARFYLEYLFHVIALPTLIVQIVSYYHLRGHIKLLWSGLPTYIFPFIGGGTAATQSTSVETSQKDLGHDDFLQLYEHLMTRWKQVLEGKKIIIVIDNLDRLDTKDARLIIDQLSLFFTESSWDNKKDSEAVYPWFIIPIDKSRFFQDKELGMAAEYFEKFFPIRLEISDISNGAWKKLLEEKLKEAFEPEIPIFDQEAKPLANNLFSVSIELFRSLFYCYDMKLYPRDIIYFVNKVVYYYLLMEKISIIKTKTKIYKSDWFKIAFLTSCYVMFIEERDGQASLKEWLDRPDATPAKNENDAQRAQRVRRIKIKTLFEHYAMGWRQLLCMGYYQTLKPYDALYHGFIEEFIKTGNITELIDLRDNIFPSKDEFNALFKYVLTDMASCLDMQAYVNTLRSGLEMLK